MNDSATTVTSSSSSTVFSGLNLSKPVLDAVSDMGFEAPTAIQERCITPLMQGRDLVGQAQTGTGKTAAFGIPLVEKVDIQNKSVQALIQCPTRELAIQVTGELLKLGKHIGGLRVVPVYGGQPINRQLKALKRGPQIVVGTPGRTIDHLQRGTLQIGGLKMLVFDEADEMLNMGFREDMEKILSYTNGPIQKIMFSATVPGAIRQIMNRYMQDPVTVTVEREVVTAPNIDQYAVEVRDSVRTEAVCRFMDINDYQLALVFCNTKRKTESVAGELQSRGFASDYINGDLNQNQRDRVMEKFRKGRIDILVATDVAARGIDVVNIDVVFNYDVPQDPEYYVHRIGRTGRAGNTGRAITFFTRRKIKQMRTIEKQIKQRLERLEMPSTAEVRASRLSGHLDRVVETLEQGGLRPYIEQIEGLSDDRFTTIETAAALLKLYSENYNRTEDPATVEIADAHDHAAGTYDDSSMIRLHFNIGKKNKVYPGDLVGAIAGETGIPGKVIGNIDIHKFHSFVDIPGKYVPQVVSVMNNNSVKGRKVSAKVA